MLDMQSKDTLEWKLFMLHFGVSDQEFNYNFCIEHPNLLISCTTYKHRSVPINK